MIQRKTMGITWRSHTKSSSCASSIIYYVDENKKKKHKSRNRFLYCIDIVSNEKMKKN